MARTPTIPSSSPNLPLSGFAKDLTLVETLRVLEVARGLQQEREVATVALARDQIRGLMRKRLMDAASITGDKITEADIDAAIEQYFATQNTYADPPWSFSIAMAHLWVRRISIAVVSALLIGVRLLFTLVF
jgi:hypothetical protein